MFYFLFFQVTRVTRVTLDRKGLPSLAMEGPRKGNCSTAMRTKLQGCHNHHQWTTISRPTDCITSSDGCCSSNSIANTSSQFRKRHSSSPAEDMISTMRSWRRPRPVSGVLLSFAVLLLINIFSSSSSSVLVQAENILKIHTTEFSNISERPHFVSSTVYNARGMAPLYNLTNHVIKLFVDSNPVPEGK